MINDILHHILACGVSAEISRVDLVHIDGVEHGVLDQLGLVSVAQVVQKISSSVQHRGGVGGVGARQAGASVAGGGLEDGVPWPDIGPGDDARRPHPRLLTMVPYRLVRTITSNCHGLETSCMQQLSMIIC